MNNKLILGILGLVFLISLTISFAGAASNSSCSGVGENVYDMEEKGPIECCSGLILKACTGVCTPSVPGTCVEKESEENKSCSSNLDCKVTSCGDCININQEFLKFCERPTNEPNFTISCECKNNRCESVKTMKNVSLGREKQFMNLSNGRKAEIKVMPETASARAIERLGELNFTVELKEVGKGKETRAVYELTGKKQGKFLGIFKIMARVQAQVDAETGDVKVIKPWWSFLASGI